MNTFDTYSPTILAVSNLITNDGATHDNLLWYTKLIGMTEMALVFSLVTLAFDQVIFFDEETQMYHAQP